MSEQTKKRIAWIGTGVMGAPMAGHLIDAGHELVIYSRTKGKAQPVLDKGATWAQSPAEAANGVDIAISMVGFPVDVRETYLGAEGILAATTLPKYIIDMTTSEPSLAVEIAEAAKQKAVGSIDAPVSGGDIGARNATLSIMVGAEESDFEAVMPLLEILGKNVVLQGGPGSGQHTKMVNQILIATTMIGVCEGLIYASKSGLDPLTVIKSVGAGAAGSWTINNLAPRMINRDFEAGFFVEHFIKDLSIALAESKRMGLDMPGLALAAQLYDAVNASGHGRSGTQALLLALESLKAGK